MKYYKVKISADQKTVANINTKRVITTLLANELYTEKEMNKKGLIIYSDYFDVINLSKKQTFFCFGVRKQTTLKN